MADPISPFLILGIVNTARKQVEANKADKESRNNFNQAKALAGQTKARAQRELTEWDATFGVIEENLADSFTYLTPDKLASLGLEESQTQYQQAVEDIRADFAKRGLTGSGAESHVLAKGAFGNAENRARIKLSAEDEVINKKLQFYGIGLNEKGQLRNNLQNAEVNEQNLFAGRSGQLNQTSQKAQADVDGSIDSLVEGGLYEEGYEKGRKQ